MDERPKIKIHLTTPDVILEIFGWLSFASLWILAIHNYSTLPGTIPIHFNASGEADDYGGKGTILILPVIAFVLFVSMTFLNRFPHIFNYPVEITKENAERQYYNATRMIRYLKFIIVFTFLVIDYQTIRIASGKSEGLGLWFLPATLGLILIPTLIHGIRAFQSK